MPPEKRSGPGRVPRLRRAARQSSTRLDDVSIVRRTSADVIDVPARFSPPGSLIVDQCPFCGRTHYHGCGIVPRGEQPDRSWYGNRVSDCREGGSYNLVPVEGEADR